MRRLLPLLVALTSACATARPTVEFLAQPNAPGPFSEAVRAGNLVFLSGAIGTDASGRLVPGGIGPETRQTLQNLKDALERNNLSMADVVKCTVFLADIGEWAAMNVEYVKFFPGPKPARSALGTSGLALGARTEIECIAAVR